jgi:transposase InsO family protein
MDRTADGRPIKILTPIDEYTKEAIYAARRIRAKDVIDIFADVMVERGIPEHIRSDNGHEMVAKSLRRWLSKLGARTLYITPGSPWENGYCESFNGKLRNELLDGETFYTLRDAQVLIEQWRYHYNRVRPHSALGYGPPAPEARGLALVPRHPVQTQRAA